MPAVFMGHGSPMLALEESDRTRALTRLGERIVERHGRPKAALMVSAHWFTPGWLVQTEEEPEQVYDRYGFPIARLIKSKYVADIIWFIMKPLEWFFLFVIYLVDEYPEDRIARQYL